MANRDPDRGGVGCGPDRIAGHPDPSEDASPSVDVQDLAPPRLRHPRTAVGDSDRVRVDAADRLEDPTVLGIDPVDRSARAVGRPEGWPSLATVAGDEFSRSDGPSLTV